MDTQRGFSIVEALLSVALFSLIASAFIGATVYGEESAQISGQRSRALLLAQEGIEAMRNIRDHSFADLVDGSYGLYISNHEWILSGSSDTTNGFVRQVTIADGADANRKQITVHVTWQQTQQRSGSVSLATELANWK